MTRWMRWVACWCAVITVSACTGVPPAEPSAEPAALPDSLVEQFALDWQDGHTQDAADFTTDPAASAQALATVTQGLKASALSITTSTAAPAAGNAATVTASMTWTLPDAGTWQYDTEWHWVRRGSGGNSRWLLDFGPQTIHPELGPGQSLAVRTEPASDGPIVDRNDALLISPVRVYSVVLLVDKVTDDAAVGKKLAALLGPIDDAVTPEAVTDGVRRARTEGNASYTVTNVRDTDFAPIETRLTAIPGITLPSQVRDLPPTAGFARTVLPSAVAAASDMVTGTPGWRIVTVDMSGDELATLTEHPAIPGRKAIVTLDPSIQDAAQAAVDPVAEPAVIVAIQPSTGEILAVAQNRAADQEGPIALMGQYPPGSTFKIATATAAVDGGVITPTTTVSCPGEWTTEHRTIHNEGFALGRVTAAQAFAHSCNTTFAMLAAGLPPDALPAAAAQYGIGLDFVIPGLTTLTGSIQRGETALARAENGFGQGTDLVTPFSAALMAATAAGGSMPMPTLIRGTTTTVDRPAPPRSAEAASAIRTMMRAVVTQGTAKGLAGDGDVHAKTGTAEFVGQDGEIHAHAWTVGFRDDLAFSALIVGGDSSKRTNDLVHTFLAAVPQG